MMTESPRALLVDASWRVEKVLQLYPFVARPFEGFGIDCGGGRATLGDAAAEAGLAPDELVGVVETLIGRAEGAR